MYMEASLETQAAALERQCLMNSPFPTPAILKLLRLPCSCYLHINYIHTMNVSSSLALKLQEAPGGNAQEISVGFFCIFFPTHSLHARMIRQSYGTVL